MLQVQLVPFDSAATEAVMAELNRRGFAVFESGEIVLAFNSVAQAVMGRLRLSEFASFADSSVKSDQAISLNDHQELASAIADMRSVMDLEVGVCRVIHVDVSAGDQDEVDGLVEASWAAI